MAQAWFYLTLWHGTPPEFTTELDAHITRADSAAAVIHTADAADSSIETTASLVAKVHTREAVGTDIITRTEVVWRVH